MKSPRNKSINPADYPAYFQRGKSMSETIVKLNNVRLAFPQLFEAKTVNGEGTPAYSASFIIPPNHPAIKELEAAMKDIAKAKWGAKADAIYKAMETSDKLCLHNGDTKADYDGYAGNKFVSSRSKTAPLVVDPQKNKLTAHDGRPYAGCYVNASISLWAQDNNYGKRINASLRGVQFLRDGEAFAGGAPADESEFDSVETESDLV